MTPPIPLRLARRPTMGGLVVPWIAVHHADGRACPGEACQGGHQVCEHHLELLMDDGARRAGVPLVVQDYTAIHVEN